MDKVEKFKELLEELSLGVDYFKSENDKFGNDGYDNFILTKQELLKLYEEAINE